MEENKAKHTSSFNTFLDEFSDLSSSVEIYDSECSAINSTRKIIFKAFANILKNKFIPKTSVLDSSNKR